MAVKSMLLLLVLVVIFAEVPRSLSFSFTKTPYPLKVFLDKNKTNVELRWDWKYTQGVLKVVKIMRFLKTNGKPTEMTLGTYHANDEPDVSDSNKYTLDVQNTATGYASFVIKDITNQGNNKDGTTVDVRNLNTVYVYEIKVDMKTSSAEEFSDQVDLQILQTPSITTYPSNQTASGGTVTFECAADGLPNPRITWEKVGSSESLSPGSPLTIQNFDASNIGTYRCTAKSDGISENATGTGRVMFSTCGSGCTTSEELGIQLTDLTYTSEYGNPTSNKYRELKNKLESECLAVYTRSSINIHQCKLLRFSGSVVAVMQLGWPTNAVGPRQPLLAAIRDGNFAGEKVGTDFVSPTSPPTDKPPSPNPTAITKTPNNTPSSGARTNDAGGLSTGAVVALVVVFSIIFIVIIVVLIVCMLKRKKTTTSSSKPYKEDGRTYDKPIATTPLKSQPFDPMYDDPNEDRYPNGGGPPPQYTPGANYAEVRPNQQDESQVEWDTSVNQKDEMWI